MILGISGQKNSPVLHGAAYACSGQTACKHTGQDRHHKEDDACNAGHLCQHLDVYKRQLLHAGKVQLFCADSIDGESLLAGNSAPRRRAEMQEKYFLYLTTELAPRILALTADEPKAEADEKAAKTASTPVLWCAGVDTGAYPVSYTHLGEDFSFGTL